MAAECSQIVATRATRVLACLAMLGRLTGLAPRRRFPVSQLGLPARFMSQSQIWRTSEQMRLQGKRVVAVAAAKRHSVVLTSSGEILTWGHRVVTPRRVVLAGMLVPHAAQPQSVCNALMFGQQKSRAVMPVYSLDNCSARGF